MTITLTSIDEYPFFCVLTSDIMKPLQKQGQLQNYSKENAPPGNYRITLFDVSANYSQSGDYENNDI